MFQLLKKYDFVAISILQHREMYLESVNIWRLKDSELFVIIIMK